MIALDTDILARFYVEDPHDSEAARQRPIARRVLTEAHSLFVPQSVILELEWVLRGFYGFGAQEFARVITHLLGLPNVQVEQWPRVLDALALHRDGMDFADALHLAASSQCEALCTFDARRVARRAARLRAEPAVKVPEG
jgi:predicted nucleic-acid-binding protein